MKTLLEMPPDPQRKPRRIVWLGLIVLVVLGVCLYWAFRFYPEKRAAERFFEAVATGDMNRAYQLWKPGPRYAVQDFLADWGPNGYYGPVKSFEIGEASAPRGGSGVIVSVKVSPYAPFPSADDVEKSRRTRTVRIWVETADKSLTFPP